MAKKARDALGTERITTLADVPIDFSGEPASVGVLGLQSRCSGGSSPLMVSRRGENAAESDIACGVIDSPRAAGGRAVTRRVLCIAKMGAPFQYAARHLAAGAERQATFNGIRDLGVAPDRVGPGPVMPGAPEIGGPFPYVSNHVAYPERIWRKGIHR